MTLIAKVSPRSITLVLYTDYRPTVKKTKAKSKKRQPEQADSPLSMEVDEVPKGL